jgi:HK97 family phage portal protein
VRNPLRALFPERKSIGTSYDLWALLQRGTESRAGVTVTESTALNVAAVMTCVSLISRTVGTLPVKVFERLEGKGKQRADFHPLNRVLLAPNPWQTWSEFAAMVQTHALLRGNGYAYVNRAEIKGRQQVVEIVPLHPDRIKVEQSPSYSVRYTLTTFDGKQVPLAADEVFHLKGLSTNGYEGRAPLQDARDVFGVAIATQNHAANFWKRDATPSVVLKHPLELSEPAKERIAASWEATYAGQDARKVAVLEEGMEMQQLSITAQDAQFLETRKFQRSEIAGWFHVPPHMIGDTEKSTSWGTGIEQQQIGFLTFTVRPWLVAWEQRLNRDLITAPDRFFVEFNVDGLLRGDIGSRYTAYQKGVQGGWLSPNDVRAFENMNPVEGGDVYLAPMAMAPIDKLPALADATIDAAANPPTPGVAE